MSVSNVAFFRVLRRRLALFWDTLSAGHGHGTGNGHNIDLLPDYLHNKLDVHCFS